MLGGSIAGLLTARVLVDHFAVVLLIEPDALDGNAQVRPGVPQAHQVHTLLPAGRSQLDRWYDGFSEDLLAGGAQVATSVNSRVYYNGRLKVPVPGVEMLMSSRPYLESVLRRRALALPRVSVLRDRVVGLDIDGSAVRAVRLASGDSRDADLVVDASGRSTRVGHWLEDAGWPAPPLERMRVDINYSTALFGRPEPEPEVAFTLATWGVGRTPEGLAPAIVDAVEGDRWIVMLGGYGADKPGRTLDALREVCARLPAPFPAVTSGELLEPIAGYTQADSRRRDFLAVDRFPARLIVIADAAASFNPIYGQGMSSAALHVSCLSQYLCGNPDLNQPARHFYDLQRVVIDAAWQTSAIPDLALPHVEAPRPPGMKLAQAYGNMLVDGTVTDVHLARSFAEVTFMRAHPNTLLHPGVVARTLGLAAARTITGRVSG